MWPICGLSSFDQSHQSVSAKMSALSQSKAQAEAESLVFVRMAVAWPHSFLNHGHNTSCLRLWFSHFALPPLPSFNSKICNPEHQSPSLFWFFSTVICHSQTTLYEYFYTTGYICSDMTCLSSYYFCTSVLQTVCIHDTLA